MMFRISQDAVQKDVTQSITPDRASTEVTVIANTYTHKEKKKDNTLKANRSNCILSPSFELTTRDRRLAFS